MDLPWRGPYGIVDGALAPRTAAFLARHGHRFTNAFVSWQPRDRGIPRPEHVFEAFDAFFGALPHATRCLHQTALNLAGGPSYDRTAVIDLTNALIERYGFAWVNEDLGSWSVNGWPLPYPQPPPLTEAGIAHCTRVCADVDAALDAPLVVEFPGFERLPGGETLDAYAAFARIVRDSGTACTLDTGHLLTWRWLRGFRGSELLDGLEDLPLERCVEIHCAGVVETGGQLVDAHHGVLVELQLALVEQLIARCPSLRVVTYEDPRFDDAGTLPPDAARSLEALEARVASFSPRGTCPALQASPTDALPELVPEPSWEAELLDGFFTDEAFAKRCRDQVLGRQTRGVGTPQTLYADALSAHPDRDGLVRDFLASPSGSAWSDFAWATPGLALEDALGRFLAPGSPEHLLACARLLVAHPDPPFAVPAAFRRAPAGWFAIGGTEVEPVLYAALNGRLVTGAITPLLVRLLSGEDPQDSAPAREKLVRLGLVA